MGVKAPLWNVWLRGHKLMREDSIQRCLFALYAAGFDVRVDWRADGCTATATPRARLAAFAPPLRVVE
jgi:hypothetical protein